ncbi:MAG: transposase [Pirellulaceae bacterium]
MNSIQRLDRIVSRLQCLDEAELREVENLLSRIESAATHDALRDNHVCNIADWPHAPTHRLHGNGTFIVTASTYSKSHFFSDRDRLSYLQGELLSKARQYNWQLEAWSIFSNHYHFVGFTLDDAKSLKKFLTHLHADTAREINKRDNTAQRQVWFNFWETRLTYEKSYLARLNYVHRNAVKHGVVAVPNQYPWCSAAWFERTASAAQVKTIYSFKTDRVQIRDDFEVLKIC